MGRSKGSKKHFKSSKVLISQYSKPFIKAVPLLFDGNKHKTFTTDGRYLTYSCAHDYCLAERRRTYGEEERMGLQKPIGLPWANGHLKYLPGHLSIKPPFRRNKKQMKNQKHSFKSSASKESFKATPEMCGVIDEMLHAYKVFMLGGMIISEANQKGN